MGWGSSFSGAVSRVAQAVAAPVVSAGAKVVQVAEKVGSSPTTAKVMPLAAIYTGKGRENLASGPYGKLAAPVASIIGGPAAGAVTQQLVSGYMGDAGTYTQAAPQGYVEPQPIPMREGSVGGTYAASPGAWSASTAGVPLWAWISGAIAILGTVLLVVLKGKK